MGVSGKRGAATAPLLLRWFNIFANCASVCGEREARPPKQSNLSTAWAALVSLTHAT